MHIFIDESGNFVFPKNKNNQISCVTALVVPSFELAKLYEKFSELKKSWGEEGELKGSKISEAQANQLIQLLSKFELFICSECIDMGLHNEKEVEEHKNLQSGAFTSAVDQTEYASMKLALEDVANKIGTSANQLYVQSCLLSQVCAEVIRKSTMYFSQFAPQELGVFEWNLDRKGASFENLWKTTVLPGLQSVFLRKPLEVYKGFDYSHYDMAFNSKTRGVPNHLKGHVPEGVSEEVTDLRKLITANLQFHDSKDILGLQIVDLVASIVSRSCNGSLQVEGWENLGILFLKIPSGSHPLGMIMLSDKALNAKSLPYNEVFKAVYRNARNPFKA